MVTQLTLFDGQNNFLGQELSEITGLCFGLTSYL